MIPSAPIRDSAPRRADAIVIGGGPAGLAAAATIASEGASVVLVEENAELGGQFYRSPRPGFASGATSTKRTMEHRQRLIGDALQKGVTLLADAAVFDLVPSYRAAINLRTSGEVLWVDTQCVVVATGAQELVLPFPGWTLPGVMTLGGAQNLYKSQGAAPGDSVVLSGAGPFLWFVAQQLIHAGVHIRAVAEATPMQRSIAFAAAERRHVGLELQAARNWAQIATHSSFKFGHAVVAADGDRELEQVTLARLDADWRAVPGSEVVIRADAVCVSYGLLPAAELTRLLLCEHRSDPLTGARFPVVGDLLETSCPRVFAAGETIGIGGELVAELEGRIAGAGVAWRLGLMSEAKAQSTADQYRRQALHRRRIADRMTRTYAPALGALTWMRDDTIVCRCEEVTNGVIRSAMELGDRNLDLLKSRTRCGMGRCQGRMCGPVIQRIIARDGQLNEIVSDPFGVRPPIKPVPVVDLIEAMQRGGATDAQTG